VPGFTGGVTRRDFLKAAACGLAIGAPAGAQPAARQTLYNGIVLPAPWPPVRAQLSDRPQSPPYILSPPRTINIDVGRQLFVDDFLIEESSFHRTFHPATYHSGNPVLTPERDWEMQDPHARLTGNTPAPSAMPFSDGVFYDPAERVFKMWYMAGYQQQTALAISNDGVTWQRPTFDVVRGTNIVSPEPRDSSTVWMDADARRFYMAAYDLGLKALRLRTSSDGVHWQPLQNSGPCGDRSTFFRNGFRDVFVFSLRDDGAGMHRRRRYFESRTFDASWTAGQPVLWTGADRADRARPEMPDTPRQLYNLDAVAYESVLVGLFGIYRGESNDREKPIDLCVAFSRDGFHWSRDSRQTFIPVSERQGDWNWANVQSAGGACLVVGDRLHFYVSGRRGVPGTQLPGICSTGLATLRRDGFASVSDGWPPGVARQVAVRPGLMTRPLTFSGRHLFVNADVQGELRVEVLDRDGHAIEQFSAERCQPVRGNSTRTRVAWTGDATLERVAGREIRFRFLLNAGSLYSFWVSALPTGQSRGPLGAGGSGYARHVDA
jgi:hypothetical protein